MASRKNKKILSLLISVFKLCKKDPKMLLGIIALGGGWFGYETQVARPALSFQGIPQSGGWSNPYQWFRVLRNDAFMIGYSDIRGNPLWVSYKISPVSARSKHLKRPSGFTKDWRTLNPAAHANYLHSGYDRGHMAPNYAISRLYGKDAQLTTFLMSNITPQRPKLNQKLWQRLESVEVDHFTKLDKAVWVLTGPIFKGAIKRLKNGWNIEIPSAFYKIYALPQLSGTPRVLAFIMPQKVNGKEPLTQFLSTVDEVEKQTGLDFFTDLEDTLEDKLEAEIEFKSWQLESVARLPSRY